MDWLFLTCYWYDYESTNSLLSTYLTLVRCLSFQGQRHGRSLGEEIGFYIGFVNTWLAMEDLQVKLTNMNHGGDTALTASTTCKTSAASAGKDSLKSTTPPSSQEKETQPSEQKQSLGPTRLTSTDVRSQQRYQQLVNLRDSLLAVRLNEPESEDIHDTIADIRRRFKGMCLSLHSLASKVGFV